MLARKKLTYQIHGDWSFYLHENHKKKSTIHVGKYTSPMDGMGLPTLRPIHGWLIFMGKCR